ncbi:MAG: DUF1016 N-terminal domain-containing protein [Bacteroidales bacterium]|nr:DUF1016 N-terminal domain-containing protein [Bacteroidales bacterium]
MQLVVQNRRAKYGKQIIPTVSAHLENKYGQSFSEKNVRRMMQVCRPAPG